MADDRERRQEIAAAAFLKRRDSLRLTQEQLAARAGVAAKTVRSFESGRTWPWRRTLARLERAVDWPQGELERLAEPPPPRLDPELLNAALNLTSQQLDELYHYVRGKHADDHGDQGEGLRVVNGE